MDNGVYAIDSISNDEIRKKISNRESFILKDIELSFWGETIETLESMIESKGLTCRIYTKGRSAAIAGIAIPTPFTILGGAATAIATAAHNIATYDPDYEIAKNPATKTLTVTYKK